MIVEMRTYKLKPGKRAEFLEIFRHQIDAGARGDRDEDSRALALD